MLNFLYDYMHHGFPVNGLDYCNWSWFQSIAGNIHTTSLYHSLSNWVSSNNQINNYNASYLGNFSLYDAAMQFGEQNLNYNVNVITPADLNRLTLQNNMLIEQLNQFRSLTYDNITIENPYATLRDFGYLPPR